MKTFSMLFAIFITLSSCSKNNDCDFIDIEYEVKTTNYKLLVRDNNTMVMRNKNIYIDGKYSNEDCINLTHEGTGNVVKIKQVTPISIEITYLGKDYIYTKK